jgi:sodium-coupled neutral amino acid transporter 6
MFGIAIVVCLPLTFIRSIGHFSKVSVVTVFLILLYLVHGGVYLIKAVLEHRFDPEHKIAFFNFSYILIQGVAIQGMAFHCHPGLGSAMIRLINPNRRRQYSVLGSVVIGCFIVYACAGLMPYLTLLDKVTSQVIFVCYPTGQMFTMITKILYACFLTVTTPLLLLAGRVCLFEGICKEPLAQWKNDLFAVLLLAATTLLAAGVTSISVMYDFVGGVSITFMIYIFPSLFYCKICRGESKLKFAAAIALIPIGIGVILTSLYDSVRTVIRGE